MCFVFECENETDDSNFNDIVCTSTLISENADLPEIEYIDERLLDELLLSSVPKKYDVKNKREVIVALIDVGISEYYSDNNYIFLNHEEIDGSKMDDDNNGYVDDVKGWNCVEDNGNIVNVNNNSIHASAMLGMLIGENLDYEYQGVLTNCSVRVVPIKALNDGSISGSIEDIIQAIEYAEIINADIVAMSFSTYIDSQELENVMLASDMLFIVAAGNEGMELNNEYKVYPACYNSDNIITVAAISDNNNIDFGSNYGNLFVDVAAKGNNIISYLGDNKFVYVSGTSFAVQFVVAETAIIACSSEQELISSEIKELIIDNVSYDKQLNGKVTSGGFIEINNIHKILDEIN